MSDFLSERRPASDRKTCPASSESALGQLGDALRVLIRHVPLDDLTIDEQDAIASCLSQLDAVDRLKRKRGRAPAATR